MRGRARLVALLGLAVCVAAQHDEIDGCGGFVRPVGDLSPKEKPDLSVVKALLVTSEGLIKSEIECSPNGYYYIPIYDKGQYKIRVKGPPGWIFNPMEQEVSTSEGLCGQGKDVDFTIAGFALAGRVSSEGSTEGPAGVTLTLQGKDGSKFTTASKEGGVFSFEDAKPGMTYTLTASHPTWRFRTTSVEAKLEFGQAEVTETFGVLGYPVKAQLAWKGSEPVSGLVFRLRPNDRSSRPKHVKCTLAADMNDGTWCTAAADATGAIVFDDVPPGQYTITADTSAPGASKIEIAPKQVTLKVKHGNAEVDGEFELVGFSVSGKVIDPSGTGVAGADVLLDGAKVATTDSKGGYSMQVQSGKHSISATKENMKFSTLVDYDLSPQLKRVSSLSIESYALCGTLSLDSVSPAKRTVTAKSDSSGKSATATTFDSGKFCFDLAPGDYTLQAQPINGIMITPESVKVSTKAGPVLDARFVQASLVIKGKVSCRAGCDSTVKVTVTPPSGSGKSTSKLDVGSNGAFSLQDVAPGRHTVSVSRDGWCWERATVDVTVGKDDTSNIAFKQTGFSVTVTASQAVKVKVSATGKEAEELDVAQGTSKACLAHAGEYEVQQHSCLRFEGTPKVDTRMANAQLALKPSQTLVTVRVTAPSKSPALSVDFGTAPPIAAGEPHRAGDKYTYDISTWAPLGASLTATPSAPGSGFLFQPTSASIRAGAGASCSKPLTEFVARGGRVISGAVVPAMAGVQVVVTDSDREVGSVVTGEDGTFKLGPFGEVGNYAVRAVKEGYTFVQDDNGDFRSVRMGEVTISVVDEAGQPLQGVLLSLSGDGGFRQNNRTSTEGSYTFTGLQPGTYFLRPILKEYDISPGSMSIVVEEGNAPPVALKAKRTAFSVYGTIRTLDGNPEKQATVAATTADGGALVEETVSEASGEYRLRGLKPGERYIVAVKTTADSRHERASPSSQVVKMSVGDKKGVDFVAFRRPAKLIMSGRVNASDDHLTSIKVEISTASNPGNTLATVPLMAYNYFEFPPMPRDTYMVKAVASLDKRGYKIKTDSVKVALEGSGAFVIIPFSALPRNSVDEVGSSSFSLLVLMVLGALAFVNRKQLMERIKANSGGPVQQPAADKATDYASVKSDKKKKDK